MLGSFIFVIEMYVIKHGWLRTYIPSFCPTSRLLLICYSVNSDCKLKVVSVLILVVLLTLLDIVTQFRISKG